MRFRMLLVAIGVVSVLIASGCSGSSPAQPAPSPGSSPSLDSRTYLTIRPFNVVIHHQSGMSLVAIETDPDAPCSVARARFGGSASVTLLALSVDCVDLAKKNSSIGNGYHGYYLSIDEVADPRSERTVTTPIGAAMAFEQKYFECTNKCSDYIESVAILALTAPVDPSYPVLLIRADKGSLSPADFDALVGALSSV